MIKNFFLVVSAAFVIPGAYAATVPDASFDRFMANVVGGTQSTITFGGTGTPLTTPASSTLYNSGPDLIVERTANLPTKGGSSVPVTAKAPLDKAAFKTFFKAALPLLPVFSTGYAVYDLAKTLGFDIFKDASGNTVIQKEGGVVQYRTHSGYPWRSSKMAACQDVEAWHKAAIGSYYAMKAYDPHCLIEPGVNVGYETQGGGTTATADDLADAIASESGWPSADAIGDVIRDLKAVSAPGTTVKTQAPTVTGPSKVEVSTQTKVDAANDTTTKTTVTNNHTYNNNTVVTTQVTNTVITKTSTGETIKEETVTDTPTTEPQPETPPFEMPCGISGKSPCNVKVDETGVNSDSSTVFDSAKSKIDEAEQAAKDALADGGPARSIEAPQWSWTFQLPAGCSPYPLEPFGMSVDVCAFQDTIHDLMSLLWVGAGLFGLLGLLRSAFGE